MTPVTRYFINLYSVTCASHSKRSPEQQTGNDNLIVAGTTFCCLLRRLQTNNLTLYYKLFVSQQERDNDARAHTHTTVITPYRYKASPDETHIDLKHSVITSINTTDDYQGACDVTGR